MNKEQIKQAYRKPEMKHYLIILVGFLVLVGFLFVLNNYQLIPDVLAQGEQPPALPDSPEAPAPLETPPSPPDIPQLPS